MEITYAIENVKWVNPDRDVIFAVINGISMYIPNDMSNRHRVIIESWQNDGGVIADD